MVVPGTCERIDLSSFKDFDMYVSYLADIDISKSSTMNPSVSRLTILTTTMPNLDATIDPIHKRPAALVDSALTSLFW